MKKKIFLFLFNCALLICTGCTKGSDEPAPIDKTANLQATGSSANDLLSNQNFTKLKIEIAYVAGFRPTNVAMNNFVDFIRVRTFKEDIELIYNELKSPEKDSLSLEEIAELESENRTAYNTGDTLGVYIYFADAPSENDNVEEALVTLGAVYRNTSMVIHSGNLRRFANSNRFISLADIEIATINHEFGHLFGLVDLGSEPVNDHEDPEAKSHCSIPGCLMRGQIQFDPSKLPASRSAKTNPTTNLKSACTLTGQNILNLLETSSAKGQLVAPDLDPECILDLQANGGR